MSVPDGMIGNSSACLCKALLAENKITAQGTTWRNWSRDWSPKGRSCCRAGTFIQRIPLAVAASRRPCGPPNDSPTCHGKTSSPYINEECAINIVFDTEFTGLQSMHDWLAADSGDLPRARGLRLHSRRHAEQTVHRPLGISIKTVPPST